MFDFFKKKRRMGFIENFVPTSKVQLKNVCFAYHDGDIAKAKEMYDFYSEGLELPDTDPVPLTTFGQIKNGVTDLLGFIKNNQDDLIQGYSLIHHIITNKGSLPLPPNEVVENIPPINQ